MTREKPVLGHVEEVRVVSNDGDRFLTARIDTGVSRTCIDPSIPAAIGADTEAGEKTFRSSTDDTETRPLVMLVLNIRGRQHTVESSVTPRPNLSTNLRI